MRDAVSLDFGDGGDHFGVGIGAQIFEKFVGGVRVAGGSDPHLGGGVAGEFVEVGAAPVGAGDERESTDGGQRIGEEDAGELDLEGDVGAALHGPVGAELSAVLDEEGGEFPVEDFTVGEGGEHRGEARGGEGLHEFVGQGGVGGEGGANGLIAEGHEVACDDGIENGVGGEAGLHGGFGIAGKEALEGAR